MPPKIKTKRPTILLDIFCCGCGTGKQPEHFYDSECKYHNNKKLNYCKDCCQKIGNEIIKNSTTFELGLRTICSFFHIPFDYEVLETIEKDSENYIEEYLDLMRKINVPDGAWDYFESSIPYIGKLLNNTKLNKDNITLLKGLENDWGKKETLDDYLFLQEKFHSYTQGEGAMTASMVNTIRYLCLAELETIEAKNKGESSKEPEKKVMDYYKFLKLDNFQTNSQKSEDEKMIENWAFIHENIHPIEWEDENLKDRLGFERDYDNIMRSMGNKVAGTKDYPNSSKVFSTP